MDYILENNNSTESLEEYYSDYYDNFNQQNISQLVQQQNSFFYSQFNKINLLDQKINQQYFEILNQQDQINEFKILIKILQNTYKLDETQIVDILNQNNWKEDKFHQHILNEINLINYSQEKQIIQQIQSEICKICYQEIDFIKNEYYSENCDHKFCLECYKQYIIITFEQGIECINSKCPQDQCNNYLTIQTFQRFLTNYLIRSMLINNDRFINCPGKNCENVIKILNEDLMKNNKKNQIGVNIVCNCGYQFCSNCLQENHFPMKCDIYKQFYGLFIDNQGFLNNLWIDVNSKKCPKCQSNIEKYIGCLHITCTFCKYEFCWLCLGEWKQHSDKTGGNYQCNLYQEQSEKKKEIQEKQILIKNIEYYVDNFNKYRLRADQIMSAQKKSEYYFSISIQKLNETYFFLQDAFYLSYQIKRAISFSYGVLYLLNDKYKSQFMQFQIQEIQKYQEILDSLIFKFSDFKEYPQFFTNQKLNQEYYIQKQKIIEKTKILKNYFQNVLVYFQNNMPDIEIQVDENIIDKEIIKEQNQKEQYWKCQICQFYNFMEDQICQACEEERREDLD